MQWHDNKSTSDTRKINLDIIKIKNFCTSKDTIKKVEKDNPKNDKKKYF